MSIFDWPITQKNSSFGKSQNRYVVITSFLGRLYKLQKQELVSLGQRIWDKVESCQEHIGEQIGKTVGNSIGTYWELNGNTMGTRKTPQHPHFTAKEKKKKKLGHLGACCLHSLAARMFWPTYILVIFGLA
jgi:hypothetical protein